MLKNSIIINRRLFLTILVLLLLTSVNVRARNLVVSDNLLLPKDSLEQVTLLNSIDSFLTLDQQADKENPFILTTEKSETQILLNEINELIAGNSNVKLHLIGVEPFSDKQSYLVQVAYINESKKQSALLACFDFIAHKTDGGFLFSSPLVRNTKDWKIKQKDHLIMHYPSDANEKSVDQQIAYLLEYDGRLGVTQKTEYYYCDDCESMTQMLQLAGIRYKVDYNGCSWNDISFTADEKIIDILSQRISRQQTIDPHDLFHFRANIAIPEEKNHYMICGAAYIYGGSWRISWEGIKEMFKSRMTYDENTDWLQLYFDRYNFGESQERHLLVTQFINALIIEKLEGEQGFSAVMKLLASGSMYKEREQFFATLEKVTGINERNFNEKVASLIMML